MATRPIDEKIVSMKLDNSDFAKKAEETTSIFGKLRDALNKIPGINLGKTTQELSNIRSEADRTNLNKLSDSVQMVAGRFTNLGIVGVTALQNITNRAVDAGIAMTKSLTLDQVTAGFQEYELKMGSIQTILANTQRYGTTLEDVSKSLNELNEYADQTIYNFGDMTRNIGLFTNAGLELEESTSMIKGFSNAAAASGANAQQSAHAAYQLSQALSTGTVRLMDWRSLTNAGMGNKNMQEDLIAIADAMGMLDKAGITATEVQRDFNGSLEKNWLSANVMSNYLRTMAGDFDKATLMANGLTEAQADVLVKNAQIGLESATYVRTFTGLVDSLKESIGSGWAMTFEYIFGDFDEATTLWTRLSNAVGGFVGGISDARNEMAKGIADKGGFLNIFDGIANASKPVAQIFGSMRNAFTTIFPPKSVDQIVAMTESFKAFTAGLTLNGDTVKQITTIFQGGFAVISALVEIVKQLGGALIGLIPPGTGGNILDFLEKLALMAISFNESVKEGNLVTKMIDVLGNVLSYIGSVIRNTIGSVVDFSGSLSDNLGRVINWLGEKLSPVAQWFKDAFGNFGGDDALGAGTLVAIGLIVSKVMGLFDNFGGIFDEVKDSIGNIGGIFDSLGEALQSFVSQVKYSNLMKIAISVGILAVSLKMLEGMETEDMVKGITALATSLGIMMAGLAIIEKFNIVGGIRASATLIALATAVSIMAISLKKISDLDTSELMRGVGGLVGVTGALVLAVTSISKFGGKIATGSLQLIALATSIYILAEAIEEMAAIQTGDLFKAIGALGIIFLELALFLKIANGSKIGPGSALGLVAISGAIHIMVGAINKIAEIDKVGLIKGLGTIGLILAEIALFSKLASGGNMLLAGPALLLIAGAIRALVGPIQTLGNMTWEQLVKGLGGMTVALIAVAGAAMLASGSIGGAVAITAMAIALNLLVIPIQAFANMTWGQILKGLVGIGASLTVLAAAAMLLAPAVPSMLGFGAAVTLMGVGMLAAGAGISLFAAGLASLATVSVVSIAAIVSSLALLIKGLNDLIPETVDFLIALAITLVDGVNELVPPLVDTIANVAVRILETLSNYLPSFLAMGVKIIVQLLQGIQMYIPLLVDEGIKTIIALIQGLSDAVRNNGPILVSTVLELLGEIILLVVEAGVQTINALFGWIPGVKEATAAIGSSAEQYIRENFGAYDLGVEKSVDFSEGLKSTQGPTKAAAEDLGLTAYDALEKVNVTPLGERVAQDFADGMSSQAGPNGPVANSASLLANVAPKTINKELQINSPSKVTWKSGESIGEGLSGGMDSKKKSTAKSAKSLADTVKSAFNEAMDIASYKFEMEEIDSDGYIAEIEKIKKTYASYPELVREANLEIKKIEEDAAKRREELRRKEFEYSKRWIDDRKYYNELSLQQELEAWERIQARYAKGTEERREADKELYRLRGEMIKEEFNASKGWIDDRKYYNELSLTEELAAWERVQARYLQGTEERKEADREVYRLKNEINKRLTDLNDEYISKVRDANKKLIEDEKKLQEEYEKSAKEERNRLADEKKRLKEDYDKSVEDVNKRAMDEEIRLREEYEREVSDINQRLIDGEKRLTDEYNNEVESRTRDLNNFAGIFDEVRINSKVTGQQLIDNLKSQFSTLANWSENIDLLSGRGLDEGLLNALREMGPKSAAEIAALNALTDDELAEYSNIWVSKNELARETAVKSLEGMRIDTQNQIQELRSETDKELDTVENEWRDSVRTLRRDTNDELDRLKSDWKAKNRELRDESDRHMEELRSNMLDQTEQLRAETRAQLEEYKTEWIQKIQEISGGTKDEFVSLEKSMEDIGADTIRGMMRGMQSMEGQIVDQAREMAEEITREIEKTLQIKSPSRVTEGIGEFTGDGLVIGLANRTRSVARGARNLATTAKDSILELLNNFRIPEDDGELHFKAVIDYDGFDPNKLGDTRLNIRPDTSLTNGFVDAVRVNARSQSSTSTTSENNLIKKIGDTISKAMEDIEVKMPAISLESPVYIDGRQMTNVVSAFQGSDRNSILRRSGVKQQ